MTKKRSSEILVHENQEIFREKVKLRKFSSESENFSKIGGNLKQRENASWSKGGWTPLFTDDDSYFPLVTPLAPSIHTHMLFFTFLRLALYSRNNIYSIRRLFLLNSSLHKQPFITANFRSSLHKCTFCASLHTKTSPAALTKIKAGFMQGFICVVLMKIILLLTTEATLIQGLSIILCCIDGIRPP